MASISQGTQLEQGAHPSIPANEFGSSHLWFRLLSRQLRPLHSRIQRHAWRTQAPKQKGGRYLSSALATLVLLLEEYFKRELNLAFCLGSTRKESKVGVRYGVIWLSRTLRRTKGRLIQRVEEVGPKVETPTFLGE